MKTNMETNMRKTTKIKTPSVQAWVDRARGTDATRPSLLHTYRDTNALVACDGHRLHVVDELPYSPTHFIGGDRDADDMQFPNWQVVLPPFGTGNGVDITILVQELDKLKAVQRMLKAKGVPPRAIEVKLELLGNKITLSGIYPVAWCASFPLARPNVDATFTMNLDYIIDAIEGTRGAELIIPSNPEGSYKFIPDIGVDSAYAIIMPCRTE